MHAPRKGHGIGCRRCRIRVEGGAHRKSGGCHLGPMRGISAFSPALRALERDFEEMRFALQEDRINALFVQGKAKPGLSIIEARRILWMYTSRDIYRMLVQDAAWTPDHYQRWLSLTLVAALVNPAYFESLPQE
jgi:hypothetical protein